MATNKELILDAARQLFNQNGTMTVTTNHIAKHMGISPGNLYYHYRNKEEIIRKIWEEMILKIDIPFDAKGKGANIERLIRFIISFFDIVYDYRFFWMEMVVLLEKDAILKANYIKRSEKIISLYKKTLKAWIETGVLSPMESEDELENMVEMTWFISQFWATSRYVQGKAMNRDSLMDGAARIFSIIRPHIRKDILPEIEMVIFQVLAERSSLANEADACH